MSIDWGAVWQFLAPVLREAVIALLMAVLAVLGYDRVVPSRYGRRERAQDLAGLYERMDAMEYVASARKARRSEDMGRSGE